MADFFHETGLLLAEHGDAADFVLDERAIDVPARRRELEGVGYTLMSGLVAKDRLQAMREHWLQAFAGVSPTQRVLWEPYLGEANRIGFSADEFQCLYRAADFLWNAPLHRPTRDVGIYLNALRNLLTGRRPLDGLTFSEDRYGIFVTTSYYPPDRGWLRGHGDGLRTGKPLVHHILPLTFKGQDYDGGGLWMELASGERVDVDARMRQGDILFYDASLQHGVDRIVTSPGRSLGRLQVFAIPTTFNDPAGTYRLYDDFSYAMLARRTYVRARNRIHQALGLGPFLR